MFARQCKRTGCSEQRAGPCNTWNRCDWFVPAPGAMAAPATTREGNCPTEEQEQRALYGWCRDNGIEMVHIPNEARRTARIGAALKAQGMRPGFPDNFFPYARQGLHGLFIELKRSDKRLSKVSPEQREWIERLRAAGYRAEICYGAEQAREVICEYVNKRD